MIFVNNHIFISSEWFEDYPSLIEYLGDKGIYFSDIISGGITDEPEDEFETYLVDCDDGSNIKAITIFKSEPL